MKVDYFIARNGEKTGAIYDTRQKVGMAQLEQDALAGKLTNVRAERLPSGEIKISGSGIPVVEDREPESSITEDVNFLRLWKDR